MKWEHVLMASPLVPISVVFVVLLLYADGGEPVPATTPPPTTTAKAPPTEPLPQPVRSWEMRELEGRLAEWQDPLTTWRPPPKSQQRVLQISSAEGAIFQSGVSLRDGWSVVVEGTLDSWNESVPFTLMKVRLADEPEEESWCFNEIPYVIINCHIEAASCQVRFRRKCTWEVDGPLFPVAFDVGTKFSLRILCLKQAFAVYWNDLFVDRMKDEASAVHVPVVLSKGWSVLAEAHLAANISGTSMTHVSDRIINLSIIDHVSRPAPWNFPMELVCLVLDSSIGCQTFEAYVSNEVGASWTWTAETPYFRLRESFSLRLVCLHNGIATQSLGKFQLLADGVVRDVRYRLGGCGDVTLLKWSLFDGTRQTVQWDRVSLAPPTEETEDQPPLGPWIFV